MPKGHEMELSKTSQSNSADAIKDVHSVTNALHILDNIVKTNPFGANVTGDNAYRRAERINAALHLVTNHVHESEPLRVSIRRSGIELLGHLLELRSGFRTSASERGQTALATIRELISLVRFLTVAGFVSFENVTAIVEALDELGSLIVVSQRSVLAEQITMSREDLVPAAAQHISRTERPPVRSRSKKDIKDSLHSDLSITAGARADQILDILKLGGNLGIKDISANLPQYSEKMIQRELANLVNARKVTKTGAKRWSRYQAVAS